MTDLALKVRLTGDGRQLEGTLRGTKRDLDGLGGSARKAGQAAGTAGGQVRQLGTHVGATRGAVGRLSTATGAARNSLGQFSSTTQSASAGLVGLVSRTGLLVAGIAGVGLGLKSAVSSFVNYDSTMRRVGAISGATEAQMGRMRDMAQELGATTRFSTGQAAEGFQFLSMAGLDAEQSMAALPGVLQLAAAGAVDLGTAADISTNILSGYGLEIAELSRVNDVLASAFTGANTNLQQLGTAFATAGPVAAAAGQEFEVTTAVLALMAEAGLAGERSGTALRGALARLLNPTAEVADTLARLGVEINDSSGQMRSLDDLMIELGDSGMTAADALTIFGQEAGPAMIGAIGKGEEALVAMIERLRNAEGTAETVAGALKGSLGGALTELGSAAEGAGIALIDLVQGAMRRVIEGITALVSGIITTLRTITPAWTEVFARITQQTATVMTALAGMVATGVTDMTGEFQSIEPSWLAVLASMPRALEATVQMVTLLAVKLTLQVANALEELKPRSAQVWNSIKATTLSIMATIEEAVVNAYRGILSAIGGLVADAGVQLIGLARTTATVSETMARKVEDAAISMQRLGRDMQTTGQHSSSLRGRIGELDAENAALDAGMRGVNQTYRVQIDTIDEMIAEYWAEVDAIQRGVDGRDEVIEAIDRESGARQTIEQQMTTAIEQLETSTASTKAATGATKEQVTELQKAAQAYDAMRTGIEDAARESDQLLVLIRDENLSREQATALIELENVARAAGVTVTEQQRTALLAAIETTEANQAAIAELTKETDKGTDSMAESWKTLNKNVQNLFADTFTDLFKGAWDGWKGLLDSMWQLFANWAGQIASQRIMLSVGMGGAGMAGSAAANAAGGGNLLGGIGSAISGGLGSVYGGLMGGLGGLLSGGGAGVGFGMASTGATLANQGLFSGGVAALGNIGSLVGAGQFAAALGAAVPILLPVAGLLAGLLGSSTPPRAYALGDIATGDIVQQVEKKGQDATALVGMIDQIVASTQSALGEIGGSLEAGEGVFDLHINPDRLRFSLRLDEGGLMEVDVDPEDQAAVTDAVNRMMLGAMAQADFGAAIDEVGQFFNALSIDMIDALPAGAAQQYVQGLTAIAMALNTDPLTLYQQALDQQTAGVLDAMTRQSSALQQLGNEFDGSAGQTANLAQGLTALQQSAVQALAQIDAARQSVTDSVASARQQIELSLMSQAQQVEYWLGEAERLREELAAATDPAAIDRLAQDTTAALLQAWQGMDEDRRGSEADFIRGFLDSIDATAATGLDAAASTVQQIWQAAADDVRTQLGAAAQSLRSAADAIRAAIPDTIHVTTSVTVHDDPHDQPGGGRARGGVVRAASGWIGAAGQAGGDTIPILVGAGEAILNRHQQRVVNNALQGQYGLDLDGLFARESRPHTAAFATGGIPDTAGFSTRAEWLRGWNERIYGHDARERAWAIYLESEAFQAMADFMERMGYMGYRSEQMARRGPPGFAAGGTHAGGWRLVGERGPELEFTPPAQIVSNPASSALLDNRDLLAEVRALREELRTGQFAIAKHTARTAKFLERWDGDGLPPERAP